MTPHLPAVSSPPSHPAHYYLLDPHHHRRARRRRRAPCPPRRVRCCASPTPREATAAAAATATMRVFVVSDLHTDYPENMDWVRGFPDKVRARRGDGEEGGAFDALVVAGDVAETRDNFARTMAMLRDRFGAVFYVPGNHDLWLRREGGRYMDSLEKLTALLDACSELGVDTGPRTIGDLGIIPLYSWHHKSFDKEKDVNSVRVPSLDMACKDFRACKWPEDLGNDDEDLALYFDKLNDKNHDVIEEVKNSSKQILTFSHFVPRQELCPEKRMLFYPHLPKVVGSDFLERRLRAIHSNRKDGAACHVFGHTHFCWDSVVDDIRYVQSPLAYPRERKRWMHGWMKGKRWMNGEQGEKRWMNGEQGEKRWLPFCVYHDGFNPDKYPAVFSDYYNKEKREPENTQLAPWVSTYFAKYHKFL